MDTFLCASVLNAATSCVVTAINPFFRVFNHILMQMSMVVSPYKSCSVGSSFLLFAFYSLFSTLYSLFPSAYTSTTLSRASVAQALLFCLPPHTQPRQTFFFQTSLQLFEYSSTTFLRVSADTFYVRSGPFGPPSFDESVGIKSWLLKIGSPSLSLYIMRTAQTMTAAQATARMTMPIIP